MAASPSTSAAASWPTPCPKPSIRRRWTRHRECSARCRDDGVMWADWVWLNGRLVRAAEASVSVFDRSFLLGDGLFETMRALRGRLFRPDRHLERLERGAVRLRLPLP